MAHAQDLTGQTFNKLTVIERVKSPNGNSRWLCQCACGKMMEAYAYKLRQGHTKSCGCTRARVLTGQKFTRLTVVSRVPVAQGKNPRWMCVCDCGNSVEAYGHNLIAGKTKSCGCFLKGPTSWNAAEKTTQNGYVFIKDYSHPRANPHTGRVREHIVVMESVLGRYLEPGEEVHHKNADRADNRPENLELWNRSQPAGARVSDQVAWALEILRRYQPESLTP